MLDENLQHQPEQGLRKKIGKQAREEQVQDWLLIKNCIAACNDTFNDDRNGKGDDHFCLRERRMRNIIKRMARTRMHARPMQMTVNRFKRPAAD